MKIYNPFSVNIEDKSIKTAYIKRLVEDTHNRELNITLNIENKMTLILAIYTFIGYYLIHNMEFLSHVLSDFTFLMIIYGILYHLKTNRLGVHRVTNFYLKKSIYYTPVNSFLTQAIARKGVVLLILFHLSEKAHKSFYSIYLTDYKAHLIAIVALFTIIQLDYYFNHLKKYDKLSNMLQKAEIEELQENSLTYQSEEEKSKNQAQIKDLIEKYRAKQSSKVIESNIIEFKTQVVKRRSRSTENNKMKGAEK